MVKNFFRRGNVDGVIERGVYGKLDLDFEMITRKPLMASGEEIKRNKRSRSAKMRIAKRIKKEDEQKEQEKKRPKSKQGPGKYDQNLNDPFGMATATDNE